MEKGISDLTSKIKALKFGIDKTIDIHDKEDKEAFERHKTSIANTAALTEGKKFAKRESEDHIKEWGAQTEAMLSSANHCTRRMEKKLSEIDLGVQEANALQANKQKLVSEKLSTEHNWGNNKKQQNTLMHSS